MAYVEKERGSNNAPSSHPLKDIIIELFQGVILEEERKDNNISNEKPSWSSLLKNIKNQSS